MLPLLSSERIWPVVDSTYTFDRIPAAYRHMEANVGFGKIVLTW